MCGIIGYIGKKNAQEVLLAGLKRLEYRGYDSAGVALQVKKSTKSKVRKGEEQKPEKIVVVKAVGRVAKLEEKLLGKNTGAKCGIAHTRWATHGAPSEKNAHPHTDCTGSIALVHNGIIENYRELRDMLEKRAHTFRSETDSEVVAHLIEEEMKRRSYEEAVRRALKKITGAYALVIISTAAPEKIIAARASSPLVLGLGEEEFILASDASAIIEHTKKVIYLDDGEMVELTPDTYRISTLENRTKRKSATVLEWSEGQAKREGYKHFMLKEIFEQTHSVEDAFRGRVSIDEGNARLGGLRSVADRLRGVDKIILASCGTSYHAALVGEYMLEEYAGIPTEVEYASEFRYRKPIVNEKTALIAISQSGETADTLAAIREAKNKGALTLGIVNTVGSTIARETDAGVYNHAGPEVSVASTKAFTSQLTILALLTVLLSRQREMSFTMGQRIVREVARLPKLIGETLKCETVIKKIAKIYARSDNMLYLGRKYNFPIALEGALKIKEVAYIHAEGYAAGEMKHGPIALIDKNFPVVVIAPRDSVYEKTASAIEEIRSRGARVVAITTKGNTEIEKRADTVVYIPKTIEMLTPILSVIPLQLLAYYAAAARGVDVDKPRNLAKSVTVE